MTHKENWFDVDREGLARLVARRGKSFVFAELLQNAYDAPGCTKVFVTAEPVPNRPLVDITVVDDSPSGFTNLDHAFTLFAPSEKVGDPALRGRFCFGEKLVLALCEEAEIRTVTGSVTFNHLGRTVSRRGARAAGSQIAMRVRMTREELAEALDSVSRFIPPIETWVNEKKLVAATPLCEIEATLTTEWAGEDGALRRGPRKTTVRIYEPQPGSTPQILELGIPVCAIDDRYSIDVQQKVPLSMERDSVAPSYLRAVRSAVLNAMVERLDAETAAQPWVSDALEHRDTTAETVRRAIIARYGRDAVVYDPSDREANGTAHAKGYALVHGGAFSKAAWERIREADALPAAGKVFPTKYPGGDGSADPKPVNPTPAMLAFHAVVEPLASQLIDAPVTVEFVNEFLQPFGAWYGGRRMCFNVARLGKAWFDDPLSEAQLALVIHELGHEYEADHTSSRYHDALTQLGARAALLALTTPDAFVTRRNQTATSAQG